MGLCVLYYVEYSLYNVKKVGFFYLGCYYTLTHPRHQPSILFILSRTVNERENLNENIDMKIAPLIWSTDTVPSKRSLM